jgi:LPS-assembly protein
MEVANFDRSLTDALDSNVKGWRLDAAPEIRMPLRGAGVYLEPAAAWRYTVYNLKDRPPGSDDTPDRAAPIFSVDSGMTFERPSGSRHQRVQTLEPRVMYLYVPYRNQASLPTFDTGAADLNLVQLFRTNRYVGPDRLSNANQVSFGVTSRLLSATTGQQYLSATIGQAYYFDEPKVSLPGEVLDDRESSDVVGEVALTAYQNWNVRMGVQFDPGENRSEKADVMFQYQPAHDRVMNLGYRFRRDNIEQVDGSFAWPIGDTWGAYGRMVYSLEDNSALDQFAGIEYRSCCWKFRLVGRRYVSNRDGDHDTSILLQLELNGLSSVGTGADTFLERSIRGYSQRELQAPGRAY